MRDVEKPKPRIVPKGLLAALPPDAIHAFSQRQDVQQALPYLSHREKVDLATIDIQARNGEIHEYLVLRQGRKRFLFSKEEKPIPLSNISDQRKEKRLSLTLVVPQEIMQEKNLVPHDHQVLRRFVSKKDARRFFRTVEQEGYFAIRGKDTDPKSIENNTDFIQPIPGVVMKDTHDNILFTIRGGKGANHDERLSGMITTPYTMGHSEVSDFGRWRRFLRYGLKLAMYREAAEETALQKDGKTFHIFPTSNGHDYNITLRGILRLHHYYRIKPLGIAYTQESPVDTLHAGVIFVATPKRRNVSFTLNGSSREIHTVLPMSGAEYEETIKERGLTPTSWDKPIMAAIWGNANKPTPKGKQ